MKILLNCRMFNICMSISFIPFISSSTGSITHISSYQNTVYLYDWESLDNTMEIMSITDVKQCCGDDAIYVRRLNTLNTI